MKYHFSRISRNRKTGPIPATTTERRSCPPSCAFYNGQGCYADIGHLALHWRKVGDGSRSITLDQLAGHIQSLPRRQLWRHNQAGDLPGIGPAIDWPALRIIVKANKWKNGFTYTHKPATPENLAAMHAATLAGFTINLSADNAAHADQLSEHGLPVVVVIPGNAEKVTYTPRGRKIVLCPAESSNKINCANCGLCSDAHRSYLIGFKPKGSRKKLVNTIATGDTSQ